MVGNDRFALDTGGPSARAVLSGGINDGIEEDQIFLVATNVAADRASVGRFGYCAVDGIGEKIPLDLRLRVRRDQVIASERAIRAIDSMFESSGGRALAEGTYLQRAWRDAHAGRVHAANDPERALAMYGSLEFGHKIDPGMY